MARRNNGMNWRRLFFWLATIAVAGLVLARIDRARVLAFILESDLRDAIGLAGFGLAMVATVLAWLAWRQRNQLRREVSALQVAIARVMSERPTAVLPRTVDEPQPAPLQTAAVPPAAVLPWHAVADAGTTPPDAQAAGADADAIAIALRTVLDRETLSISLRPIVSLGEERPVAYDAFVRVERDGAPAIDMRRLAAAGEMLDAALFERLAIIGSMKAARRLGDGAIVHASASGAFLSSATQLRHVVDAAIAHPRAARGVVLDLAPEDASRPGPLADAIDLLEGAGLTIGLDFAAASDPIIDDWPRLGIRHVRVPAAMLLGHGRRQHVDGRAVVGRCKRNDIAVIADDIDSEEALVTIAESGIDLVTGDRFGRPRPMRQTAANGIDDRG